VAVPKLGAYYRVLLICCSLQNPLRLMFVSVYSNTCLKGNPLRLMYVSVYSNTLKKQCLYTRLLSHCTQEDPRTNKITNTHVVPAGLTVFNIKTKMFCDRLNPIKLHGVTSQKTVIEILHNFRNPNSQSQKVLQMHIVVD
jgi:hypothetical protein